MADENKKNLKRSEMKKYEIDINEKMINDENNKSDDNNKSNITINNNNNDNDENNSESLHKDAEISDYELLFSMM